MAKVRPHVEKISFVSFTKLSEEELLTILSWRNRDDIRLNMDHPDIISPEDHLNFCRSLQGREDLMMFRISCNDKPCGVVTLRKIDKEHRSVEVGSYFIERGYISTICSKAMSNLCLSLGLDTLNSYVKKDNLQGMAHTILKYGASVTREDEHYVYCSRPAGHSKLTDIKVEVVC